MVQAGRSGAGLVLFVGLLAVLGFVPAPLLGAGAVPVTGSVHNSACDRARSQRGHIRSQHFVTVTHLTYRKFPDKLVTIHQPIRSQVPKQGRRTCKPNSVVCGHSSRRRVATDVRQRPTRRFRRLLEPSWRAGPARNTQQALSRAHPPLFGLAPCGVYPASVVTAGAVRSYRTFSPLPRRESWPDGRTLPEVSGRPPERGVAEAVCFLWHWPSTSLCKLASRTLSGTLPCGVRTFLPRRTQACARPSGSDRPVLLPVASVPQFGP